jgi:hypothetical protein
MKNIIYLLLLFPVLTFSQSNTTTTQENTSAKQLNTNVTVNKSSIQNQFSNASIMEYQNQAISTIKDFYDYINLYQSSDVSNELKIEIDKSVQSLFLNNSIQLKNIFENSEKSISLDSFLNKCKNQAVVISASHFNQNNTTSDTYFTFTYNLQVTFNNKTTSQTITQKVYFFPSLKSFGDQQKNVWQLKLGEF